MDFIQAINGWCGWAGSWSGHGVHGGGYFWGMSLHSWTLLIILALVALLLFRAIRRPAPVQTVSGLSQSPEDILKRRYALGEISKEEFDRIKRELHDI
ncbi:SHOCT domain-containing protein [Pseudodesulfovibrio tunisiensis]|uniref:SHOCT domain-containing protein n=1 Tax=Pseudodesulfovibrio tunisiensis TaxID=463192 RepID=UPI001FB27344|nr:SHOCT domain-containing protein [Pseudodesulfovibrio tunisiensis]